MNGLQENPMSDYARSVTVPTGIERKSARGVRSRRGVYVNCEICGKESYYKPFAYKNRDHFYCSRECKFKSQLKQVSLKCETCGKEYTRPESTVKWQVIRGNHKDYCSRACYGVSLKTKFTGESHHSWRGGSSRAYKYGYHSLEYKEWREWIFERDLHTCQYCGKVGGYIEAHHIFSFSSFPDFRFANFNGMTLCRDCHNTTKINFRDMRLQLFKGAA